MSKEHMLTTYDNPFDPFEQFIPWLLFDIEMGYNSCEKLAQVAQLSDNMTQKEESDEIERAIDEVIFNDELGIYQRATQKE